MVESVHRKESERHKATPAKKGSFQIFSWGMVIMCATMKAVVWGREGRAELVDRPIPTVQDKRDAVVRVTRSAICTSDLHILHGAVPRAKPGVILGHEFAGEVAAVGSGVHKLSVGDRVAANCITFCGECWFCERGYINNCERGGWELGCRIDGCHAEYVRVPFADRGLSLLPACVTDEQALFVGDILSTGYFGAKLCDIRPGDTVAVIGAGPVGLCSMECARLLGAGRILALDIRPDRLAFAKQRGLADEIIDCTAVDPEQAVFSLNHGRGADGVIEAAGGKDTFQTAWRIARPNASVALIAMYEQDQTLPLPSMYGKNLIFKTGGVDAVDCDALIGLIAQGRLNTDYLITHKAPLNDILEGYRVFGGYEDHCLKWVVTPYVR